MNNTALNNYRWKQAGALRGQNTVHRNEKDIFDTTAFSVYQNQRHTFDCCYGYHVDYLRAYMERTLPSMSERHRFLGINLDQEAFSFLEHQ